MSKKFSKIVEIVSESLSVAYVWVSIDRELAQKIADFKKMMNNQAIKMIQIDHMNSTKYFDYNDNDDRGLPTPGQDQVDVRDASLNIMADDFYPHAFVNQFELIAAKIEMSELAQHFPDIDFGITEEPSINL